MSLQLLRSPLKRVSRIATLAAVPSIYRKAFCDSSSLRSGCNRLASRLWKNRQYAFPVEMARCSPGSDGHSVFGNKVVRLTRKFEGGTPLKRTALRTAATSNGFYCLNRLFVIQSGPAAVFCKSFISAATSDTWTGSSRDTSGPSFGDMCVRLSNFFSDSKMLRQ